MCRKEVGYCGNNYAFQISILWFIMSNDASHIIAFTYHTNIKYPH